MRKVVLKRKLRALQLRVELVKTLIRFLRKHPSLADRSVLCQVGEAPALYFFEKAYIRPVWTKRAVTLRLERDVPDAWAQLEDAQKRVVHADVSGLRPKELAKVLRKVDIDVKKAEQ